MHVMVRVVIMVDDRMHGCVASIQQSLDPTHLARIPRARNPVVQNKHRTFDANISHIDVSSTGAKKSRTAPMSNIKKLAFDGISSHFTSQNASLANTVPSLFTKRVMIVWGGGGSSGTPYANVKA
jgi:hypothetical protein